MTEPPLSRIKPWTFGVGALGLTFAGWLLLALSFTASAAAWWNDLYFFAIIYIASFLLALRGFRSGWGILALILAALSLGFVGLFLYL